ncbi:hypothetical protein CSX00_06355 [Pseudobutyrivibrio ruminis]|uniref:Uncharacterized protein n=1 Tax=Pseudobutyrivibrio ruminis TaxID=46206 RepID=A0A2G3EAQ6_9FIRM|nr:glycosyltransferase [Pseudobutyrivibrio ruminis]PHU40386.1 hypothetical protein CSX00_06355 [Pseudobutyrivibrio ruminis]
MYKIIPHAYDTEFPWNTTISERIEKLLKGKKQGKRNAVYLYELADTSTFRYRVYNVCQALDLSIEWNGVYFFASEMKYLIEYIDIIDVLVIARFRWTQELSSLISKFKSYGIPVGFESDDMIFDNSEVGLIMNTLSVEESSERYDYWFSYLGRMERTLQECDFGITTNDYLSKIMSEKTGKEAYVIKNFMNRLQLEVSDDYYEQKKRQASSEKFVIGYFSGTPSHINDFRVVAPELINVLEQCPNAILRIVGFLTLPKGFEEYVEKGRVEQLQLVNFVDLQQLIAEVDVNIAPLMINRFTNCKSELKYFEAAAVGTITCATPTFTFNQSIKNGVDGYLLNQGEWSGKLLEIYNDKNKNNMEIIKNAKQKSIDNYAFYNMVGDTNAVFDKVSR